MYNGPQFRCERKTSSPSVMEYLLSAINENPGAIQKYINQGKTVDYIISTCQQYKSKYKFTTNINPMFNTKPQSEASVRIKFWSIMHL